MCRFGPVFGDKTPVRRLIGKMRVSLKKEFEITDYDNSSQGTF